MSAYDSLNTEQLEAVTHVSGPLLILAGAGSGKTRVLTHRIAYLIEEQQVSPFQILAITFTNKAAGEMRERIDRLLDYGSESVWVATFHSTCVRILHRYIDRIGYENNFTIYDAEDQKSIIKGICKRLNIDVKRIRERAFLNEISSAKNECISCEEYAQKNGQDYAKKDFVRVYREYEKELQGNNALDFDDLLVKTVELFRSCPDVLEYYQKRFRYIMVDEYQDTNKVQFEFVRLLASVGEQNLCVVGDDDQSIYKFRGANIRNILDFEYYFPNTRIIKLEQNYRSTQNILDAANGVIRHNAGRKEKKLWTEGESGDLLTLQHFHNGYDEGEYVVEDIATRVRRDGCQYGDFAILYRTNAQSRIFEEKLVAANVPYRIVGGINFYGRREIKDILAYLKTIANGRDDLAVRRIINVPKRGIGAATVEKVQIYANVQGISFMAALEQASQIPGISKAAAKIQPFVELIHDMRNDLAAGTPISDVIHDVIERTDYMEIFRSETEDEEQARRDNVGELVNKVIEYEKDAEVPDLNEFLEEVALVADIDSLEEDEDRVLLMTLHSAKGLEFPNVYLVGMEDGLFPSYMTITSDDKEELEEERRLCYVGITRAMKRLVLTCADSRMVNGETRFLKPSRFLGEIPKQLFGANTKVIDEMAKDKEHLKETSSAYVKAREAFQWKAFGAAKNFEVKKADALEYGVGDRVSHVKFGVGTVLEITEGGRDYEVTVDFGKNGASNRKKMFASFAKLKKVEGS